uniref:Ig-like domain-containing protein n=1 Tax=Anabas testudineus TaxID=64144 RepID=A0AAQ6ID33_ANATE
MENAVVWTLLFLVSFHGIWGESNMEQSPPEVKRPGDTVKMSCVISGFEMTSYYFHWIRQKSGKVLEWIGRTDGAIYARSFQRRFIMTQDVSNRAQYLEVRSLTSEDSAVYFCLYHGDAFDFWGKGTEVTVSSGTTVSPTLFPVAPCKPGPGDKVTVACVAHDFYPNSLSFQWSDFRGTILTSAQYPPTEKNHKYTGASLVQVSKSDWDSRKSFKCSVNHAGTASFLSVLVLLPTEDGRALLCLMEDGHSGELQSFKWKKNGEELNDYIRSPVQKVGESHSAVSVLKIANTDWESKAVYTCEVVYRGKTYMKKTSKAPITVTLDPPSSREIFRNNQAELRCVITGQDMSTVQTTEISWQIDGQNVSSTTGPTKSEGRLYSKTSTLTRSRTEWERGTKVSCSAVRPDVTPMVRELHVQTGDGSKPKVTVHILPEDEISDEDSAEVTVVCLVSSPVLQDYYIAWSEDDGHKNGNYIDGINFPPQKSNNGYYSVASVYRTTKKTWDHPGKLIHCSVWPAGSNEPMTPRGVSKVQGNSHECDK